MASILDAGVGSLFTTLFVFLLVYTLVWGVLKWKKPLGDNSGAYAIFAFVAGFLMSIAPPARNFVTFVTPWFIALAVVVFFMLFLTMVFGWGPAESAGILKNNAAQVWLIIACIIILIAGLAFTFGQGLTPGGEAVPITDGGNGVAVIGPGGYQEPGMISPGVPYPGYNTLPGPGEPGSTATSDFGTNLTNTFFHPKVLGLMVTILVASLAVYFLSKGSS